MRHVVLSSIAGMFLAGSLATALAASEGSTVRMKDGSVLHGHVRQGAAGSYEIVTRYGSLTLQSSEVASVEGPGPVSEVSVVHLADGSLLRGRVAPGSGGALEVTTSHGALSVPLSEITRMEAAAAPPPDPTPAAPPRVAAATETAPVAGVSPARAESRPARVYVAPCVAPRFLEARLGSVDVFYEDEYISVSESFDANQAFTPGLLPGARVGVRSGRWDLSFSLLSASLGKAQWPEEEIEWELKGGFAVTVLSVMIPATERIEPRLGVGVAMGMLRLTERSHFEGHISEIGASFTHDVEARKDLTAPVPLVRGGADFKLAPRVCFFAELSYVPNTTAVVDFGETSDTFSVRGPWGSAEVTTTVPPRKERLELGGLGFSLGLSLGL